VRDNDDSRRRLADLATRLSEEDLRRDLGRGWTVSAALAHVAFWDRSCLAWWDRWDRDASVEDYPDALVDVVNAAGLPDWRALPPAAAVGLALAAAEEVDARVAALPDAAVAHAEATKPPVPDRAVRPPQRPPRRDRACRRHRVATGLGPNDA
jgi:hypothetical protein